MFGAYTRAMQPDLALMYDWVRRTRQNLLEFTDTLPNEIYTRERPDFAYGSIRNIHAHIAFGYLLWVGVMGLGMKREQLEVPASSIPNSAAMRARFDTVDAILEEALSKFDDPDAMFERQYREETLKLTQRWVIVRPITHEFHHKGQLLALARVLGHGLPPEMYGELVGPFEE
jgi:uncharacterized damage-inducible protein DinB